VAAKSSRVVNAFVSKRWLFVPSRQIMQPMAVVRYLVDDVDAAVAYYTGNLGFALERVMGPAFAIVARDDLTLWLSGPQSSAARPMPNGNRPEPGGWNRLVLEVEDLEATVERLKQAGLAFRNDIVSGPGGKQILLDDSAGNPVELFQPA
jgi:catechol 2,3-dioxygenase-like lactoylglutathione lyase family enzyme